MTGAERLLCAILDCKSSDLSLLEKGDPDWDTIIQKLKIQNSVSLEPVIRLMVAQACEALDTAINDRICELEAIYNVRNLDRQEKNLLRNLEQLHPDKDIDVRFNYLDTHLYFKSNQRIYRTYCPDLIHGFENLSGFSIS